MEEFAPGKKYVGNDWTFITDGQCLYIRSKEVTLVLKKNSSGFVHYISHSQNKAFVLNGIARMACPDSSFMNKAAQQIGKAMVDVLPSFQEATPIQILPISEPGASMVFGNWNFVRWGTDEGDSLVITNINFQDEQNILLPPKDLEGFVTVNSGNDDSWYP